MSINQIIFKIIKEKHLKQSDLAKKLGVRTSVITTWKTRGTNPPIEYAVQICEFLGISLFELFEICNPEQNEIEQIYKMLLPEDKQIVDIIFNKYKKNDTLSLTSTIG